MGILGAIVGAVSTVASAIGGFVSRTAPIVGEFISKNTDIFLRTIPKVGGLLKEVIETVGEIIEVVAKRLGLIQDEKPEELGAKATQEGTKSREEFESTEKYLKYIREEVQLDKERFRHLSEEEKLGCKTVGITIISDNIREKTGVEIPPESLAVVGKAKMTGEEFDSCLQTLTAKGVDTFRVIGDYLSNKGTATEKIAAGEILRESIQKSNPNMEQEKIEDRVIEMIDSMERKA